MISGLFGDLFEKMLVLFNLTKSDKFCAWCVKWTHNNRLNTLYSLVVCVTLAFDKMEGRGLIYSKVYQQ